MRRVKQLQRIVDDACLLAENIRPDFYHFGKEPAYMSRSTAAFSLRKAKKHLDAIEAETMAVMQIGQNNDSATPVADPK